MIDGDPTTIWRPARRNAPATVNLDDIIETIHPACSRPAQCGWSSGAGIGEHVSHSKSVDASIRGDSLTTRGELIRAGRGKRTHAVKRIARHLLHRNSHHMPGDCASQSRSGSCSTVAIISLWSSSANRLPKIEQLPWRASVRGPHRLPLVESFISMAIQTGHVRTCSTACVPILKEMRMSIEGSGLEERTATIVCAGGRKSVTRCSCLRTPTR